MNNEIYKPSKYERLLRKIEHKLNPPYWTAENCAEAVQEAEKLLQTYLINLAQTQDKATIALLTARIEELQNALRGEPVSTEPTAEKQEARLKHLAQKIAADAVKAQREERKRHLYLYEVIAAKREQRHARLTKLS